MEDRLNQTIALDDGRVQDYNPKIKMVRVKTLMKGDVCCNHRYEWTG